MTIDHVVFAIAAVILGVIGYVLYFRSIFRGETKPHLYTWSVYFLIDVIVFSAQFLNGAGPGAWVTLTGLIGTFSVSAVALRHGEKHITLSDRVSFTAALIAIVLWQMTGDALIAVIIAACINYLALYPTFRKSWIHPEEESVSIWTLDAIRFTLALFALDTFSLTNALFPAALVVGNVGLIAMILVRGLPRV